MIIQSDNTATDMAFARIGGPERVTQTMREFGLNSIRATGIFQLDKNLFLNGGFPTPGYRDWRGSVETSGQFNLSDQWVWGWNGTWVSDKTYMQDYGLQQALQSTNLMLVTPDYALSQVYLAGRGERSPT